LQKNHSPCFSRGARQVQWYRGKSVLSPLKKEFSKNTKSAKRFGYSLRHLQMGMQGLLESAREPQANDLELTLRVEGKKGRRRDEICSKSKSVGSTPSQRGKSKVCSKICPNLDREETKLLGLFHVEEGKRTRLAARVGPDPLEYRFSSSLTKRKGELAVVFRPCSGRKREEGPA